MSGNGARYSVAHAKTAREHGCTVGGYGWLYAGIDGNRQVADFLDTAFKAQIVFSPTNPLWLDCEDDTDGSYPSLEILSDATDACARLGVPCGIYTAAWWWIPRTDDDKGFCDLPLWAAVYDGNPNLIAPGFGGWTEMAGHQYTSTPVDRSVFNSAYATP